MNLEKVIFWCSCIFFPLLLGVKVEIVRGIFFVSCQKAAVKKTERMVGYSSQGQIKPQPLVLPCNGRNMMSQEYYTLQSQHPCQWPPSTGWTASRGTWWCGVPQGTPACFTLLMSGFKPFLFLAHKNVVNFYEKVTWQMAVPCPLNPGHPNILAVVTWRPKYRFSALNFAQSIQRQNCGMKMFWMKIRCVGFPNVAQKQPGCHCPENFKKVWAGAV